jgi:hypothetical protein
MLKECGVTKQGHRLLLLSAMLRLKDEEGGMLPVDTPVTVVGEQDKVHRGDT